MNLFLAILLGIIQGLTEFLPVSSTAHLTIAAKLAGLIDPAHPETWTAFMAVMQLGTMAAVLAYFREDIGTMTRTTLRDVLTWGGGKGPAGFAHETLLALYIAIGTVPVAIIGIFLHDVIEGVLTKSTLMIIASLVGLASLLWLAEKVARHLRTLDSVTWVDALLVGCAQALALVPGSSRSGTTITASLFLGFTRHAAARFSFLLSIPAVLASGLYEMYKVYKMAGASTDVFDLGVANLIVATLVSGIAGYAAIAWLLRFLMKNTTMTFVWYRFGLGLVLTLLLMLNIIEP